MSDTPQNVRFAPVSMLSVGTRMMSGTLSRTSLASLIAPLPASVSFRADGPTMTGVDQSRKKSAITSSTCRRWEHKSRYVVVGCSC